MSRISTHVLDTALGVPAAGITVHLEYAASADQWQPIAAQQTDADGRCSNLLSRQNDPALQAGLYRLRFETGPYHIAQSVRGLYPMVEITVTVRDGDAHLHVPLLLSPNGYTTYRGS
jgi:5-hydroxyisourate hydrolase